MVGASGRDARPALPRRLAAAPGRLIGRVASRIARLARWQLLALASLVLLFLLWSSAAATSTSVYTATVLVTKGSHGIAPPDALFDFGDLPPTAAISHKLTLKNEGKTDTYVMVMVFGGIRDFLDLEDAFFNLKAGQEREVLVKLTVPATAEAGKRYNGKVVVARLPWWSPLP